MSVQSTLARIGYTISGAGPYTIPYYFLNNSDLIVIRTPASGADPVTLVLTTDYTVTGVGSETGGTLTLVAPVNGDTLTIINEPPINQLSTFPETGKLPAKSIESALDKLTMAMKRVYDLTSRGLRLNDGDLATSFVFPISASGKLIGWGSDGKLTNTTAAGVGPNSIGATEIIDGAVTVAKIADPQLTTLAGITTQQATDIATLSAFVGTLMSRIDAGAFRDAIGANVPSGVVIYTAQGSPPDGYLKANGAAINRTTYAPLFAAIGTIYGAGDGSTTFNVPELRGEFMRGWDDGRGVDASRVIGSTQAGQVEAHAHTGGMNAASLGGGAAGSAVGTGPVNTGTMGGNETRPRNVALLACIKY